MKRVSYQVALAIKNAGYPQEEDKILERYLIGSGIKTDHTVATDGFPDESRGISYLLASTYLEVWLWLSSQGGSISPIYTAPGVWEVSTCNGKFPGPEEAITAAIDYLVENNYIK